MDFFLNQYEEAIKKRGPFGYLLIDLTTTQDNCRLRTNVLPSEGFNKADFQENIPQELLKYLKQQTLSPVPLPLRFFQLCKKYRATWMTYFLETVFGTMKKLSDTFSFKTDSWLLKNN